MFPADTLEGIRELSVAAIADDFVKCPGDADYVAYQRDQSTKSLTRIELTPKPRSYVLHTLEDFAGTLKEMITRSAAPSPIVFCGRGNVTAILDEVGARREVLRVSLPYTEEFKTLKHLNEKRTPMDHRAFINLLRINLANCILPEVLSIFRSLKISTNTDGESKISVGSEAVGKRVQMELLSNGKAIPEELVANVQVYRDIADKEAKKFVGCAVDTNMEDGKFTLIPVGADIETVERELDAYIKTTLTSLLSEQDVKVFCGSIG